MAVARKALEATGVVDAEGRLVLDAPLEGIGPSRVRALIVVTDELDDDEVEWLRAAATSPALAFLNDPAEEVYSLADGRPLSDPR